MYFQSCLQLYVNPWFHPTNNLLVDLDPPSNLACPISSNSYSSSKYQFSVQQIHSKNSWQSWDDKRNVESSSGSTSSELGETWDSNGYRRLVARSCNTLRNCVRLILRPGCPFSDLLFFLNKFYGPRDVKSKPGLLIVCCLTGYQKTSASVVAYW